MKTMIAFVLVMFTIILASCASGPSPAMLAQQERIQQERVQQERLKIEKAKKQQDEEAVKQRQCLNDNLLNATMNGDADSVSQLLAKGADANAKTREGVPALMVASVNGKKGHLEVVKLLLDAQADVNAKNGEGSTASIAAFREGHWEIVKFLKKAGAEAIPERELAKRLGEIATQMAPATEISFSGDLISGTMHPVSSRTSKPSAKELSDFKELLNFGANPNLIRIKGYKPQTASMFSGDPGRVVPAEEGGMTLLEYCRTVKLDEAVRLLASRKGQKINKNRGVEFLGGH